MNIGRLDERIDIIKLEKVKNRLGEVQPTPSLLKTIWAEIAPRTGSLLTGRPAETMLSKTTHVVVIRAEEVKDVTTDCYIEWTDYLGTKHKLTIDYILPPTRSSITTNIYCQEVI